MKIGVISDTHNFLDPAVFPIFAGVEHILHAGDVGLPRVLLELEKIAPVTAVCGNTDDPGHRYRQTEVVSLAGAKFLIHHIVNPMSPSEHLRDRIDSERPDVIVFGHTHKQFEQRIGRILFLNPGYAGKQRFSLSRTVAVLDCREGDIQVEFRSI